MKIEIRLEITKRENKGITNQGRFEGLQIGEREITNRDRDFKSEQGLQIRANQLPYSLNQFSSNLDTDTHLLYQK